MIVRGAPNCARPPEPVLPGVTRLTAERHIGDADGTCKCNHAQQSPAPSAAQSL